MDEAFLGALLGSALGTFTGWFSGSALVAFMNARNLRRASKELQTTVTANTDRLRAAVAAGVVAQAARSEVPGPTQIN